MSFSVPFTTPPELVKQVVDYVWQVPEGQVVSYGQIAAALGVEDARLIGYVMSGTGDTPGFPWWRVLNNEGKITIKDPAARLRQKELLEAEGIAVNADFRLDIDRYRFGAVKRQQPLL